VAEAIEEADASEDDADEKLAVALALSLIVSRAYSDRRSEADQKEDVPVELDMLTPSASSQSLSLLADRHWLLHARGQIGAAHQLSTSRMIYSCR
jgi:hypothetical protein